MKPALNVVCVKWGAWCAPHSATYVNNLAKGVAKHLTLPYRFICFTDDPAGLDPGIEARPLPENLTGWWWETVYPHRKLRWLRPVTRLPYLLQQSRDHRPQLDEEQSRVPYPIDLRGWYNKLFIFKPGVLEGPSLFLDLDTVIVRSIDDLAAYSGDFCILRDFPKNLNYNSSVMLFRPEAVSQIWTEFVRRGCPAMSKGDQEFIQEAAPEADFVQDLWPGHVVSYKIHCRKSGVRDYVRIVCFHGLPRPHDVADPFLQTAWSG